MRSLFILVPCVLLIGGCQSTPSGCATDNDCKGERICEAGVCVNPSSAATAEKESSTAGEATPDPSSKTPTPGAKAAAKPVQATPPAPLNIRKDAPRLGAKEPLVIITEFGDFQCQFCRHATGTIRALLKKYGAPDGDLSYEWRNSPLTSHDKAMTYATAAAAAHIQDRFWPIHDVLFQDQAKMTEQALMGWAHKLKLNMPVWESNRQNTKLAQRVQHERAIAVALGARGTPAFFVNGRLLPGGMQSEKQFEKAISEELAKAKALQEAKTPRAEIASQLQRKNNPDFGKYVLDGAALPQPAQTP